MTTEPARSLSPGAPLRYGIIGSGMMGIEHMWNIRLAPDSEVVAYADTHETSRGWGRDNSSPEARAYEDHRALLADGEVDAVVIATPNFTHADVLRDAFQSDKHILVEKPLCTTLEDCRWVVDAAAKHPGVVWVAMEYRYMPPAARLIEEIRSGTIGSLRMLAIREHRMPFLPKVGDWNRFNRNTGGTLVEKCCHFFDLMNLIAESPPVRVFASGGQDVNHLDERYDGETPDILDNAYAVVDFEDGSRALLDLCMFAEGTRNHNEIAAVGDAGKVECSVPDSNVTIGLRHPRTIETHHVPVDEAILKAGFHHGSTYYQHLAFQRAVRGQGEVEVSPLDGLWAVALGVAAQRSIEERRPIEIAELGLDDLGGRR
ncbi:MAG: Gfo/Idh/MocA family protein [Myxococcota bacterium]